MFDRIKQILWGALFGTLIATQAMGQASLLPNGVQQYLDQNGSPVASGHVDYFIPNTTTRKTTWSSSTEGSGTQNPNPVLLNAGGFPQNGSGQTSGTYGDGIYRQRVVDQNGNTIWDATTSSTGSGSGGGNQVALGDNAYVGVLQAYSGTVAPLNYMFAAGQLVSRTSFSQLFTAITLSIAITCSASSPTISGLSDTTQIPIGAPLEAICFAPGTTVLSKTASSVTMSRNATVSTTVTGIFFPWGNGNGSTTFTLPNLAGLVPIGRDNLSGTNAGKITVAYYGVNPDALGAYGGSQNITLATPNLPPYTPAGTITNGAITAGAITNGAITNGAITITTSGGASPAGFFGGAANVGGGGSFDISTTLLGATQAATTQATTTQANPTQATSTFAGTAQNGSSTPVSVIQPGATVNYIIKVTPDSISSGLVGVTATFPIVVNTANAVANISLTNPLPVTNGGSGGTTWAVGGPLLGNGTNPFAQGIPSGNTSTFATTSGLLNSGHCVQIDSSGNLVDSGTTGCGGGGSAAAPVFQIFSTPGSVTTLTLTTAPLPTSSGVVSITFDGVVQARNTWSINIGTSIITFNSSIPANVQQVEVDWWAPLAFTITGTAIFQNIAALRSNSSVIQAAYVQGYTTFADGGEGTLNYVSSDITTADNGCTVFVDAAGHRYYRTVSIGINVMWCGAKGNGVTNDQTAFQSAINVSCPGHLAVVPPVAAVNQISPVIVPASANPYIITELNATNCAGFTMTGIGSGALQPVIKYTIGSPGNTIMDLTGSCAGLNLNNFQLLGPQADGLSSAYPNIGMLIAATSAGGCNYNQMNNVNVAGRFQQAGVIIYGTCCSLASMISFNNYNQNNSNTYGLFLTSTNATSIGPGIPGSSFTTIATGTQGMSDWTFDRSEVHTFLGLTGSSPQSILFDSAIGINWIGGQIGSCNTFLMRTNGTNDKLHFMGTTFYCDNPPTQPTVLFGAGSGTLAHVLLDNVYIKLGAGGTLFNGQSFTSGTMVESTYQINATVTQIHYAGIGTSPTASVGTVAGSDQDGTVTTVGTQTGTSVTFATPFNSSSPACTYGLQPTGFTASVSASGLAFTWTSASGIAVTWHCQDKVT